MSDIIAIFDFKEQRVRESAVKCPVRSKYKAVLIGNKKQDKLAVFGFINRTFKEPAFKDIQVMPLYLIEMAAKWYSNEQVYLLEEKRGESKHWKINVDDILRQ